MVSLIRPTLINLNHIELNCCPFMISLNKYSGCCRVPDDVFANRYVRSETSIDVKVFIMLKRVNETKTLVKHISCDCKCRFSITTCNSNQK